MLTVLSLSILVLVMLVMGFWVWQLLSSKGKPLKNREFGYLRIVLYLLNVVIFGFGLVVVTGTMLGLFYWLGGAEWLSHIFGGQSVVLDWKSPVEFAVHTLNAVAVMGIFICMRLFIKNILTDNIFVHQNVKLARLSTLFLILGSFVKKGVEGSGLLVSVGHTNEGTLVAEQYSFFSLNYLLAAVLVWTLSIILEKAIAIAEENEFTI